MFISRRIKLGLALTLLGGTFLFSHSAYASDISISNSGKVSFGKVQPSSIGTLVTGEDSLSISTTCAEGVNVYATSVNGNDTGTSLVNLAAKAQDAEGTNAASYTINTSSATIGSAAALTDNTWGLNTNASEAGNGLYYGLPAFSDSTTPTAIYTGTDSSIPVYFGAKVTNTLATGTYNGQVLYTAVVNTACLDYTIAFDKNATDATGTMTDQVILPAGGSLKENSFELDGYAFLGWSTNPAGKTGTAANGIGTSEDVEYENGAIFPDINISPDIKAGDDVTLYAIWGTSRTVYYYPNGGSFSNGKNPNVVIYDITCEERALLPKYSHTHNLSDDGTQNGSYNNSLNTNEVITIPGASKLHIRLTYNTESCCDWVSFWEGSHPSYTANSNYSSGVRIGGNSDGRYLGGQSTVEGDINGDTVTFSFYSDSSVQNYGYYAVITGLDANGNPLTETVYGDPTSISGSYLVPTTTDTENPTFLGWSTDPSATSATYKDDSFVKDLPIGATLKLYAVWGKIQYMQTFDCSTLSANEIATLVDSRDKHEYKVKKLPDGKCWMINNLTLTTTDLVTEGKALTSANTNIPSSDTNSYYITPKNARYTSIGSFNNSAVASASASVDFSTSYSNYIQIGYRDKNTTDNDTGNPVPEDTAYYSFYTATLGYSYYNDGKTSGSSTMDICPKGWRLPKVSDNGTSITAASSEFANLARAYNGSASWSGSGATNYNYYTSDTTIRQNMIKGDASSLDPELDTNGSAGFTYAGGYSGAALYGVGTAGDYWSSSVYNSNRGYSLFFNTSGVYPQYLGDKYSGFAVRCVAEEPTMQNFDPSSLAEGESTTLTDARDNHKYKVKKLPDGKVWMINNLTLTATDLVTEGKALTNANTNIPSSDTNSYYITPKNARYTSTGSFNNSAVASASASVDFSSSYPNYIQIGYRDKNTTDNNTGNPVPEDTAYYNFYTATLGYSYYGDGKTSGSSTMDICPKGWRLSKVSDNGTSITAASSEFANLARAYNGSASWSGTNTSYNYYTTDSTIRQNMIKGDASSLDPELDTNGSAGFTYAGYYDSATLDNVGASGYYWSSSMYNSGYGYNLYFNTSNVYPQYYNRKYRGFAVRCVAQ